jgi:Tol biopolymer transport system component
VTSRSDIDNDLDELEEAVRRAFGGESLSAEQQQRHLGRLRSRRKGARAGMLDAERQPREGRSLGRLWLIPRDGGGQGRVRPGLQFVAGMVTVAVVAVALVVLFEGLAGLRHAGQPAAGTIETPNPRGWTYPGADLPGGGQLAFVSSQDGVPQIAVVNADGSGLSTVTTDASTHWSPGWSPDGEQLTWSSDSRGAAQVYVANADGSGVVQRSIFLDNRDPLWSPDGAWIAFISTRDMRTDIYVMPAAGGREVSITNGAAVDWGANMVWSPDSGALAFETAGDLYVVNRDGSGLRQLTNDPAIDSAPDWSPDGSRIAFFSNRDDNFDIYVINADGSGLTNLTETPEDEYQPVWSPDGWTIAYLRAPMTPEADHETQLWSMGANGAGVHRLGDISGYALSAPSWSPDSRQLAVIAAPEGSDLSAGTIDDGELYVISAGGSNQRLIADHAADLGRPAWRPLWWPQAPATGATGAEQPALTLSPAQGNCASRITVRGTGFESGVVVNLYGAPAIDSNFAPVGQGVIVAADGSFETPIDLRRFAGCSSQTPTGGVFNIGATIERGFRNGAMLSDLSASADFTVRE